MRKLTTEQLYVFTQPLKGKMSKLTIKLNKKHVQLNQTSSYEHIYIYIVTEYLFSYTK